MSNPQTWNRYAYVGNSPLNMVDPLGLIRSDARGSVGDMSCVETYSCNTYAVNGMEVNSGMAEQWLHDGSARICPECTIRSIPGAGWAFPSMAADDSISWSFSFSATYKGVQLTNAALAEALGLSTNVAQAANNGSFTKAVLPEGPYTNVCRSGQVTFLAPASFDMSAVVAAGNAGGLSPSAANTAVGQYGTFDYQRSANSAGDTIFYSGYTNVSNFGVGAYLYGTGVPQWAASGIANTFAFFKSSNAGDPNQASYRNAGYSAAASGGQITCSRLIWGP